MSDLLFDSFGGLFGDPQNAHGDCENPFVYAWPESTDADDQEKFLHNSSKKDIKLTLANSETDLMAHHVWEAAIQMSNLIVRGIFRSRTSM